MSSGFGFLFDTAGFAINLTLVPYDATSTYGRAFFVGTLNTLLVSSISIVLATVLGVKGGFGETLGLANDWVVRIIESVGNYGESVERSLGESSGIGLPRDLNNLWTDGGLHYAPPMR